MNNKKGLSTVVTTLIIVLLVLAAIGIIWGPIKAMLQGAESSIDKTVCLNLEVSATRVANHTAGPGIGNYDVTLTRSSTGNIELVSAKVILFNDDTGEASNVISWPAELTALQVSSETLESTGVYPANRIEVTPTYKDKNSGETIICDSTTEYSFIV